MTTTPTTDPGHLMTVADWEQVVQEAEAIARGAVRHAMALGKSAFPSVTGFIQAKYNGGTQPGGKPTFGVLHDAETPLSPGYATSISNYFSRNTNETSAHFMLGPDLTYQLLDTSLVAWHCGNGNTRSIGVEQAGYAAFTPEQWLTQDGIAQMHRLADLMRDIQAAHGIGTYFMDDATLLRAYHGEIVGGWATHDQCRRVLGGTSHTDPMPNYPFSALEQVLGGTPPPPPAPVPVSPPPTFSWNLAAGNYYGDINGPNQSHGGYVASERAYVKIIQQWFVYLNCVPGVPSASWRTTGWCDGKFTAPYSTDAAIRWHARYYPGQPKPAQMWKDDVAKLFASRP